jgi:hypothetical protein
MGQRPAGRGRHPPVLTFDSWIFLPSEKLIY